MFLCSVVYNMRQYANGGYGANELQRPGCFPSSRRRLSSHKPVVVSRTSKGSQKPCLSGSCSALFGVPFDDSSDVVGFAPHRGVHKEPHYRGEHLLILLANYRRISWSNKETSRFGGHVSLMNSDDGNAEMTFDETRRNLPLLPHHHRTIRQHRRMRIFSNEAFSSQTMTACGDVEVKMANVGLGSRSNETNTHLSAAASRNEPLAFDPVPPASASDVNRSQKILEFYKRKTVAHRRSPLAGSSPASEIFRTQRLLSEPTTFSNRTVLLSPYPSTVDQVVRIPWVPRQPATELVQRTSSNPVNDRSGFQNVRDANGSFGSFVLLQPLVVGVQRSEVRSPQIPTSSGDEQHHHHNLTRTVTLPEAFVDRVDDSLFVNLQIVDGPSPGFPTTFEDEIYEPLPEADDEEEVKAPDVFGDDASCTICSGIFRDPRVLSCGHTFCLKCLVRLHRHARQAVLVCPICREETIVYSNDLKYLTKNFVVKNLVETIKLSSKNEKQLKSQLKASSENQTQMFDTKMSVTKEPRKIKSFPLREGRVKGVAFLKQKIFLIFERSNQILTISTKTFLLGNPRREEIILIEELSNPLGMASRAERNVLFILDSSSKSSKGIFNSSVWKVVLPDGKSNRSMKNCKWLDGIQTRESIVSVSDSPMVMLLVFEGGKFSINFYFTEKEFGEMAKTIRLDEIVCPVQFSRMLGGTEIAVSHFDESSKTWMLSLINLDGNVVKEVNFDDEVQLSSLTSDHLKNVYFIENKKNQIFKMDSNLEEKATVKLTNMSSETLKYFEVVDEKKFVACFDQQQQQQLCIFEF